MVVGWLLLLAAQGVAADDRADFEKFWIERQQEVSKSPLSKETAWRYYQMTQAQFSLGFCSAFIPSDVMAKMTYYPEEADPEAAKIRRLMLDQGDEQFRSGMAFRERANPTASLCQKELRDRDAVQVTKSSAKQK